MKRMLSLSVTAALALAPISPALAASSATMVQDPSTMTEEEKMALAKTYFVEAQAAFKAGDFQTAVVKYEEAYFLVPSKHGFAYKVGITAWELGDCVKADEYFRHFVTYETRESKADQIAEAKRVLGEIAIQGCATAATEEDPLAAAASEEPSVGDDEPDLSSQREQREAASAAELGTEDTTEDKEGMPTMMKAGIGLAAVGVVATAAGVTGLILRSSAEKQLLDGASTNTPTAFPAGTYDDEAFRMNNRLPTYTGLGIAGLAVGGASLVAGGVLIGLGISKKNKAAAAPTPTDDGAAPAEPAAEETAGLRALSPIWMQGGGGAAASFKF